MINHHHSRHRQGEVPATRVGSVVVTEASQVSPQGKGYSFTPGNYSSEQVAGWRLVSDAVHEKRGRIFLQLWHVGRMLAFKSGDAIDLRAKSGKPLGRYFPEVVSLLRDISAPQFVVDGELVIESKGRLAFDVLQMRLHPAESRIRKLSVETPARLILFDMLVDTDGRKLIDEPLEQRREALEAFLAQASVPKKLVLSSFTRNRHKAEEWLNESGHGATDGVVAKRLEDPYKPGARTMIKVKRSRTADCVVGGARADNAVSDPGARPRPVGRASRWATWRERRCVRGTPRCASPKRNAELYAVGLAQTTRAIVGLGLDPSFGFLHRDKPGRLSFSYDCLELIRPRIDRIVFGFTVARVFERRDLIEAERGHVRLSAQLAREIAGRVLKEFPFRDYVSIARKVAALF